MVGTSGLSDIRRRLPELLSNAGIAEDVARQVEATVTRSGDLVVVVPGHDDKGRAAARIAARALERHDAGYVPSPERTHSTIAHEKALVAPDNRTVETPDGYRFEFENNEMRVYTPGRDEPSTTFRGREVTEADGTQWSAEQAAYVLPNRAVFRPEFTDDGNLKNVRIINGDSVMDVEGLDRGDEAEAGKYGRRGLRIRKRGGGFEARQALLEDAYGQHVFVLGGRNRAGNEDDVVWGLSHFGTEDGIRSVLDGFDPDDDDGHRRLGDRDFFVDPDLVPEFGTHEYERMLRAQVNDVRAAIVGRQMESGSSRRQGQLIADFMLGADGTYDEYAREMAASAGIEYRPGRGGQTLPSLLLLEALRARAGAGGHGSTATHGASSQLRGSTELLSKLGQLMQLQQAFGGLMGGTHVRGFDEAMSALSALKAIIGSHGAIAHDYATSLAPALTHIASPAQRLNQAVAQAQAAALAQTQGAALALPIVRAVETVAESGTLSRFGTRAGAIHHDPFAAALRRRHSSTHGGSHKTTHRHDVEDDDRAGDRDRDRDGHYKSYTGRSSPKRADKDAVKTNIKTLRDELDDFFIDETALARQVNGLNTPERLSVLESLSAEEMSKFGGQIQDDPEAAGHLIASLARDAKKDPKNASKQLGRILGGMQENSGWFSSDPEHTSYDGVDTLRNAFKDLAGSESLDTDAAKDDAAKALSRLDLKTIDQMDAIGRDGLDDQQIIDVVARAKVIKGGFSSEAVDAASALSKQDESLAKDQLLSLRSSDRLKVLKNASQEDFDVFVDNIATDDQGSAILLRELSRDARSNRELGNEVMGRFLTSLDQQSWDKGDVLEEFLRTITRGDLKSEEAMRLANRALSGLSNANLSAMETMLKGTYPYSDSDAVHVIQRVRSKRS
ncbi:MAG: hypothetical protein IPK13_12145 [Deltaproteobacteria bacterium]|nr:hypothetical protein [Deltaproteobacteria bacterium]